MWSGDIVAYMISTSGRRDVRRDTIANLAATDWDDEPVVLLDQGRYEDLTCRATDNARSALLRALDGAGDVFLFLEDDLAFNRWLRFNIEHWSPLVERPVGAPFFASLYNPDVRSLSPDLDGDTFRIADPEAIFGSQAYLLSTTTAALVLRHWDDVVGAQDIKMPRIAARKSPVYYHLPSLVQHRPVPSVWGGLAHSADDFSPDWRAG